MDQNRSKSSLKWRITRWTSQLSSRFGVRAHARSRRSTPLPSSAPPRGEFSRPATRSNWTQQHDRAICALDAQNHDIFAIVARLNRDFPNLRGSLTAEMIDKRLHQLDQNIEIDYWRAEGDITSTSGGPNEDEQTPQSQNSAVSFETSRLTKLPHHTLFRPARLHNTHFHGSPVELGLLTLDTWKRIMSMGTIY